MASQWPTPPLVVRQMTGFKAKVESIAVAANGTRLFAGTTDGVLTMFEARGDTPHAVRSGNIELVQISQLLGARSTANRKPVSNLVVVDEWRALLCVAETCLTVYDINTCRQLTQVADTRGTALFAIHEPTRRIVVVTKKKQLLVYGWAGGLSSSGPLVSRSGNTTLPDMPVCMCCAGDSLVVIGYKKSYVLLDLASGVTVKLLDVERPGVAIELPRSPLRPSRVLLSSGSRGVFVNLQNRAVSEERLSWSAPPLQVCVATPFLAAVTERAIEIHDLALLRSVQSVPHSVIGGDLSPSLCTTSTSPLASQHDNIYYLNSGASSITLLNALPLKDVVEALTASGRFEEALSLCDLCPTQVSAGGGLEVAEIHEQYATSLLGVGDFEASIGHFIQANSHPHQVLLLFPSLVPSKLPLPASSNAKRPSLGAEKGQATGYASPNAAARAAAAVVRYLENQRPRIHAAAEEVDRKRRLGCGGQSSWQSERGGGSGVAAGSRTLHGTHEAEEDEVTCSASMVDTVLLVARLSCMPPRRWDVVDLLSRPNRCHEASCLPLLAERGVAYAEALLWLYRSVGAHERVLQNLSEERCVSASEPDSWSREQFFKWTSDYLRFLWHSTHAADVRLVVTAPAKGAHVPEPPIFHLLRKSPLLGLRVFLPEQDLQSSMETVSPRGSWGDSAEGLSSLGLGGIGFSVKEVAELLLQVTPDADAAALAGADASSIKGGVAEIPLTAKRGVAITYLEALIGSGLCSAEGHDELGLMLIQGLEENVAAAVDSETGNRLKEAYSHKLRSFLLESKLYDPLKMLSALPTGVDSSHEKALILSRLGKHQDVLRLYVSDINDVGLAEAYCARIYGDAVTRVARAEAAAVAENATGDVTWEREGGTGGDLLGIATVLALGSGGDEEEGLIESLLENSPEEKRLLQAARDVYLDLIKVYLDDDIDGASPDLKAVVSLLNRHFTRINPVKALAVLPPSAPLSLLVPFLGKAMLHLESQRRSMQVKHGLLKVHFMNVSHEVTRRRIEQLSDMAQVPALARLGTPRASLPSITLSEHSGGGGNGGGEGLEHRVTCVRHLFESGHVVLQFAVTNQAEIKGQNISNVLVRVVSSDDDLYDVEAEIELPFLPFSSTGSCYIILREKKQTIGTVHTSFSCDLYFDDRSTPLQNLEISTDH